MWEKYGVDFIREDGKWKIWHMKVYTDWAMPMYESGQGMGGPGGGAGGQPPQGQGQPPAQDARVNAADKIGSAEITGQLPQEQQDQFAMGKPDVFYKKPYMGWTATTSPQLIPRPPDPYRTWSETWSYADDGE
jgi:hypothetical protein